MSAWRVGGKQPHNIYRDDEHVMVVLGEPGLAAVRAREVVAVLNHAEAEAVTVQIGFEGVAKKFDAEVMREYISRMPRGML